jgi:hypothetical protein
MFDMHAGAERVNDILLWDIMGVILIVQQKVVAK